MKIGTHVRLADGREATVVFNGLSGVGVKWGLHHPAPEDFEGTFGDCGDAAPDSAARKVGWPWHPEAMLRDSGLETTLGLPCVGEDYEVIA